MQPYLTNTTNPQRREKYFGINHAGNVPHNRHTKRAISAQIRTNKTLTRIYRDVARAILWESHNATTGRCFPSYERIALAARCCRASVAKAIKNLERARILTWARRLKWMVVQGAKRAVNSSNAYRFLTPENSKSTEQTVTPTKAKILTFKETEGSYETQIEAALDRLKAMIRTKPPKQGAHQ